MQNASDIKRHITGGSKHPGDLYLTSCEGTEWASNRYWVAPSCKLSPLLAKFNIAASAYGRYEVNGSVHKLDDSAPDTAQLVNLSRFTVPLIPVSTFGHQAYVQPGTVLLALYVDPAGHPAALPSGVLAWLADAHDLPLNRDEHFGEIRYLTDKNTERRNWLVAVVADVIRTIERAKYDTNADSYVPAVTKNLGPRLLGVLMTHAIS